jgi:hypothetical protein
MMTAMMRAMVTALDVVYTVIPVRSMWLVRTVHVDRMPGGKISTRVAATVSPRAASEQDHRGR